MSSTGKRLLHCNNSKISARIPLQSPPKGGDSFPPGEAMAAAPLIAQTTIYRIIANFVPTGNREFPLAYYEQMCYNC
jgi:hypothetical protein